MAGIYRNLVGERFNRLLVTAKVESIRGKFSTKSRWACLCDCGKRVIKRTDSLKSNKIPSCGCAAADANAKRQAKIGTALRTAIAEYKSGARRRGLEWALSDEMTLTVLTGDCYYCGAVLPREVKSDAGEIFRCTGIDRLDNASGYLEANVVSCCAVCNVAKSSRSLFEFKDWIVRVYNNWGKSDF